MCNTITQWQHHLYKNMVNVQGHVSLFFWPGKQVTVASVVHLDINGQLCKKGIVISTMSAQKQ